MTSKDGNMKNIIVIGSGIGGLTAAVLLAQKGHGVTIFESHTSPGGYTAGFWRKGFYFESGTLAFESSGVLFKALKDTGVFEKVRCLRKKDRWVSPYFDFSFDSYARFKEAIQRGFPAEKEALDGYFHDLDPVYEAMAPFIDKPYPTQFSGLKAVRAMLPYLFSGRKFYRVFKKFGDMTVVDLADKHFPKGTPLHRLFSDLGYPLMGIGGLGGYFVAMTEDYWHVADGMQHLADALAARLNELGGELKCHAPVDKILTREGAAVGVTSDGKQYQADFVISACDYKNTFLKLLDTPSLLPQKQLEKIMGAAVSEGIFTVYLGLDMANQELLRHMRAYTVSYSPLEHDLDLDDPNDPEIFRKSGFSLHSLSLINPQLAPEGKSSLMIHAVCPTRWQDNWHKGDREKYAALKNGVKAALIERAAAIVPGLKSRIEFEDAASPLTFERYTRNTDGATSAWSWNPNKKFYEGGMMAQMSVVTPVRNLLIGSCWANQIGGVPSAIAAAYLCAKKVR